MTHIHRTTLAALLACGLFACDSGVEPAPAASVQLDANFNAGTHGWLADFTDFPEGEREKHQVESGHRALPQPLDTTRRGYMLSGMNHSDDMFMYIRRRVTGLFPDTDYDIGFRVTLATDAPAGCAGVGGAPGESVVLKAGAAAAEPVPVVRDGDYRLDVDKGEQLEEGTAALILGNMATTSDDCFAPVYELKQFDSAPRTLRVRTDAGGRVWLFVGTESGFEARTRVYITRVQADLQRVSQ